MVETLDKHRSAKNTLVDRLKDQGVLAGYQIGISLKGVEVRVLNEDLEGTFPEKIDGVPVVVIQMAAPPTKRDAYAKRPKPKKK